MPYNKSGRVPSCEKSYPRKVGSISACGLGEKWQHAVDLETNGAFNSCQNLIFPVLFWSVGYLTGVFCGIVESWYFALNCLVFAKISCIIVAFHLFLVFGSALKPNFLEFCS